MGIPDDHDALYERGVDLIWPYMQLVFVRAEDREEGRQQLRAGIACLDRVLVLAPSNWAALWFRGKALQSLGDHEAACLSFARAYGIESENPDVGREYMLELLEIGDFKEAVAIGEQVVKTHPKDTGLLANLALAQLLNQDLPGSSRTVDRALELDPTDPITRALKRAIDAISAGLQPYPKSLAELEGWAG